MMFCHKLRRALILGAACCLPLAAPAPWTEDAAGQGSPLYAEPKPPADEVTVEVVQSRLDEAEKSTDVDETTKAKIRELYQQVLGELNSAESHSLKAESFTREVQASAEDIRRAKSELASLPNRPDVGPLDTLSPEEIENRLKAKQLELTAATTECAKWENEPKRRAARRVEIATEEDGARKLLADTEARLVLNPDEAESPPESLARRTLLLARRQAMAQKLRMLDEERKVCDATVDLLPARHALAVGRLALVQQETKQLQARLLALRSREIDEQVRLAEQAFTDSPPLLRPWAEENVKLAKERKVLQHDTDAARRAQTDVERKITFWSREITDTYDQIKLAGLSDAIGLKLRDQRSRLPDMAKLRQTAREQHAKMHAAHHRLIEVQNQVAQFGDLDRRVEIELTALASQRGSIPRGTGASLRELLASRQQQLVALSRDCQSHFYQLVDLDSTRRELSRQTEDYIRYIDERVLWIRSNQVLGPADVRHAVDAVLWLANPQAWGGVGRTLLDDFRSNPLLLGAAAVALVLLIRFRSQANRTIVQIGERAMQSSAHQYLPTPQALLMTVVSALPFPSLMIYVGWRLAIHHDAPTLAKALGIGLVETGQLFLLLSLIRQTCRAKGLAGAHFGWTNADLGRLRKYLRWLMLVVIPLALVANTVRAQENLLWQSALGRAAFSAAMLWTALLLHRLFRPWRRKGVLYQVLAARPDEWFMRLRLVWYAVAVGAPLALAVLSVTGYDYTANRLTVRFETSVWLLFAVLLAGSLLLRWVLVNRRRLALKQARERREADLAAAEAAEAQGETTQPPSEAAVAEPALDLTTINTQTRQLLLSAVWLVALVGFWHIWVDVLPALEFLDQVPIWGSLSLVNVAVATLVVLMTYVAAKNIPGLLEMGILQRLPLDASLRYTITTVCRYSITVIGILSFCGALGIEWSKVQWLVAALTVGLGFGLQEIFANFVSGLIVLVERPVRVGDLVTIGDVNGTVTNMRMRATTIQDWNRRELIVPNKELVTGKLINWTLTDSTYRVDLRVGVAYGSDVDRVREILLKIAEEHPNVLEQPKPKAIFRGFGESALDCELRIYIPHMDYWPRVVTEVNTEIARRFRDADVEIAFPQRDIHIRSIHGDWPPQLLTVGQAGGQIREEQKS